MYVYMHGSCSATVYQSQHEVNAITVYQAFIMNSDERREARLRRRRERRAAESSEETISKAPCGELGMLQIQTGEQSVAESVALLKALSRGRRD